MAGWFGGGQGKVEAVTMHVLRHNITLEPEHLSKLSAWIDPFN